MIEYENNKEYMDQKYKKYLFDNKKKKKKF